MLLQHPKIERVLMLEESNAEVILWVLYLLADYIQLF